MYVLGISAFYHDSAAVLIKDGKVIAALEEERFSRVKHSFQFPYKAIEACLKKNSVTINDIDSIAYYEKPLLRFERVLDSMIESYPHSLGQFLKGIPEWLGEKIKVEHHIRKDLKFKGKIHFIPHHLSHASSSFFSSPFKDAAILTIDGIGEYQTTGLWKGEGKTISPIAKIDFPDSIGLLYSTFTAFLGFRINEDEYKVMGLSAYGKPKYADRIKQIVDIKPDGSFKLDMSYFSFHKKFKMWNSRFEMLFGNPRKSPRVTSKHKDIAASIQLVTEEIYLKMIGHLYNLTGSTNLCIGGGVALNALANGKIIENTPFRKVFIIGSSGDSGGALGAAEYVTNNLAKKERKPLDHLLLGTSYTNEEIRIILDKYNLKFEQYHHTIDLVKKTASVLSKGNIVGWFQGDMEFGPRALGARSILAKPWPKKMKDKVNNIKKREQFRPFAGSVLQEHANTYFEIPGSQNYFPFMNFCFQVKNPEKIPAITHNDNSCRIQTVSEKNGIYYSLIREFYKITGVPILLNTSFNIQGEPIVETPEQAVKDFLQSKIDYLVIGPFIVSK